MHSHHPNRQDSIIRTPLNLPPTIEYYDNGLDDLVRINKEWEAFRESQENITCEKVSDTEFKVACDLIVANFRLYFLNQFNLSL